MLPRLVRVDHAGIVRDCGRVLTGWAADVTRWLHQSSTLSSLGRFLRWCDERTGIPALLVAALLAVLGYRVLRSSARLAAQVGTVALALALLTELGFIHW